MQNALRLHDEISQFTDQMVMNLADWETLPYDSFSPHQDIISSRLSTLYQLPTMQRGVLIVPVNTLMQRVCPHSFLHGHALVMKKGQRLSRDALRTQLDSAGYRHVDQVMEHGEYATRGALLDLFPMGSELPYRLDFFDDEIDSLRVFDVDSQRTLKEVDAINLLPAHEFPTDKAAIELFRSQWRDTFEVKRDPEHIYQQVSKGTLPAGIEYWQPLFFSEPLPPLFSYFPANTLLVNTGDLENSAERFQADTLARFENRGVDPMRPLLPPQSLWLRVDELFSELKNWPRVQLKTEHLPTKAANANLGFQKLPDLAIQAQQKAPLDALRKFLESFDGPVVFSVESEGRREALGELLARIKIAPQRIMRLDEASDRGRYLMIGAAEHGFVDTVRNLALICESDLLGERVARRRQDSRRAINPDTLIRNLAELHIGQPVVHLEHGVGRYAGMTTLEAGGITGEYLRVEFYSNTSTFPESDREMGNKSYGLAWDMDTQLAWAKLRTTVGWDHISDYTRHDHDIWYTELSCTYGDISGRCTRGGLGHISQAVDNYTFKTRLDWQKFTVGNVSHQPYFGAEYIYSDAWTERHNQSESYVINAAGKKTNHTIYHKGKGSLGIDNYTLYMADRISWRNVSLMPGVRYDYDNYLSNHNISPRFMTEWDIFADQTSMITAGYNRYYGGNILDMGLRDIRNSWTESVSGNKTLTRYQDLKTPYKKRRK